MEMLKMIKEQLLSQVANQMGNLKDVDTEELGEAIDMIKDMSEAIYYCEIYEQMKKSEEQKPTESNYYYTERYYPYDYQRDKDYLTGRMYYGDGGGNSSSSSGNSNSSPSSGRNYYTERDYPISMRDEREGRSPLKRKMYMESKDMHHDQAKTMKELETYLQELTQDMMEVLERATPDEKAIIQKKINTLATKVQNV